MKEEKKRLNNLSLSTMKKISGYNKALKDAKNAIMALVPINITLTVDDVMKAIDSCKRPDVTPSLQEGPGTPPTDPKGGGTR